MQTRLSAIYAKAAYLTLTLSCLTAIAACQAPAGTVEQRSLPEPTDGEAIAPSANPASPESATQQSESTAAQPRSTDRNSSAQSSIPDGMIALQNQTTETVRLEVILWDGTDDDDTLNGTQADEVFNGFDGDDVLNGNGGDDTFNGGAGDDTLNGSGDDERMDGGDGDDLLNGNGGDDTLSAGSGDDQINGSGGDELISGGAGDDLFNGNGGDDTLNGGAGDDIIRTGGDDDVIDSGTGDDFVQLNGGDDIIVLSAGPGFDEIENFQLDQTRLDISVNVDTLRFVQVRNGVEISVDGDLLAFVNHTQISTFENHYDDIFM